MIRRSGSTKLDLTPPKIKVCNLTVADRPADECPYPRPFPEDFADCPAYQPRFFVPLDTSYRPLHATWTCRHLEPQATSQRPHGFYAACMLGDAAARRRWAAEVKTERLAAIAALRQKLASIAVPYLERLWEIKGRQLRAIHSSDDPAPAKREMERVGHELLFVIEAHLKEHEQVLHQINLSLDACLELLRAWLRRWIAEPTTRSSLDVPDDLLGRLPDDVRLFLGARSQAPQPAPASPAA